MIATKQAKAQQEVKGGFTHEVLRDGRYVAIGTEVYRNAAQRETALSSGKAWQAKAQVGARVVEHFTEAGKSRHVIRVEGAPVKAKPIEEWSEVDCALEAQERRAVDLCGAPPVIGDWQRWHGNSRGGRDSAPDIQ